jgi:hypothetical protein
MMHDAGMMMINCRRHVLLLPNGVNLTIRCGTAAKKKRKREWRATHCEAEKGFRNKDPKT